jgi:MerR HTH family regulatory protein
VSPDTLRHYENLGILKEPPRSDAGYSLYPVEALNRVLLIRNALAVGFSLDELTRILCFARFGRCTLPGSRGDGSRLKTDGGSRSKMAETARGRGV